MRIPATDSPYSVTAAGHVPRLTPCLIVACYGGMKTSFEQECTILFADIAGSTQLYERLGDQAAKRLITSLQDVIATTAEASAGRVQEVVGDEVMVRFASAGDGAACALQIQDAIATFSERNGARLAVRIGLHCGTAIVEGDRMFGDMINVAARVAAIAQGGQIITTQAVVERLPPAMQDLARQFDVAPVKGKREPLVLFDLPWQRKDLTMIAPAASARDEVRRLELEYAGQQSTMSPDTRVFTLGRDPSCDLVVTWPAASRRHAEITFTRGRFVLTDTSTNGTYLTLQNGQEVFLRREHLPLWGLGRISLGATLQTGRDHAIDYRCD